MKRRWYFTHNYSGNPVGAFWAIIRVTLFLLVAFRLGWSWWLVALIVSYVELEFS